MFIDLFWFGVILIISLILPNIIFGLDLPYRVRNFLLIFFFFGVIVHEISHAIASLFVGLKVESIKIRWRNESVGIASPHGSVLPDRRRSFMQEVIISLAPLFVSTWLFFVFLDITFNPTLPDYLNILAGFFCLSLLMGAAPSHQDFRLIPHYFKKDIQYSLYQVLLLSISIPLVWLMCAYFRIEVFGILYFFFIGISYYCIKYFLIGISTLYKRMSAFNYGSRSRTNGFNRRTHRPLKPRINEIEEAHW